MKLLKRMAVLGLAVLALSACTKSSEESETVTGNEVDPAKQSAMDEVDETLAREDNILVEDETEPKSLYEWDQVKDETDTLFADADLYPQTVKMEFAADEASMTIDLSWVLKNGTSEEEAEEYAAMMVKQFNDIVAVQSTELELSLIHIFVLEKADYTYKNTVIRQAGQPTHLPVICSIPSSL